MAYNYESGIDFSGALGAIATGMENVVAIKRQQDKLAESRVDDFLKTYQPGKLYQMDIPKFTNAYNQYKQAALTYSKINRGGGKAEDLAASKAMMDNAQAELNKVYTNSSNRANLAAEYGEVAKYAMQKGYSLPEEVSRYTTALTSADLDDLDLPKIPSAYTFKIEPEDLDSTDFEKFLKNQRATPIQRIDFTDQESGRTYMGKNLKERTINIYQSLPIENTIRAVNGYMAIGRTGNALKRDADIQMAQFKQLPQADKDQIVADISKKIPRIQSESDITPAVIYGYGLSQETLKDQKTDERFYNTQIAEINKNIDVDLAKQRIVISGRAAAAAEKRASQGKSGGKEPVIQADRELSPWIRKNTGGTGVVDVPKSLWEGFQGESRDKYKAGVIEGMKLDKATGQITVTVNDGVIDSQGNKVFTRSYGLPGLIRTLTANTTGASRNLAEDDGSEFPDLY